MSIQVLNEREAASALGLSVRSLQRWRITGGGPAFRKLGECVRYTPEDLQEWLDKQKRTSTSDRGENPR